MTADQRWWTRYNEYLASDSWRSVRTRALARDGWRCRRCGAVSSAANPLQAHHTSYANYNRSGQTKLSDLVTLCSQCHAATKRKRPVHDKLSMPREQEGEQLPRVLSLGVAAICVQINVYFVVDKDAR